MKRDVLVIGAGPAGLSAASACAAAGLRVALIAPDPDARWTPTYCAWTDEVPGDVPFDAAWPAVEVRLGAGDVRTIPRRYGRIDGPALQDRLRERAAGLEVLRGVVRDIDHDDGATHVLDQSGRVHRARVVIDATGPSAATSFQTAHGLLAEADGLDGATPRWMDFSAAFGPGDEAPSFLYALPLPGGVWLLEETALVRSPAVPHHVLQRRLEQRLGAMGVRVRRVAGTERVTIPMDAAVDAPAPVGTVPFGAAAGMNHPATGYLVPRVLEAAPRLADAIARGLDRGPEQAIRAARAAIWPEDALRRHRLFRFGAAALARLGADDTRRFFAAFFSMSPEFVAGYLGDRLSTRALAGGMAELFGRLPARVRWRIVAAGSPAELVRAVLTPRHGPPMETRP